MSFHGLDHHVGNTPLIRLNKLSELTGCEILAKAEFMNPGGSVKDRAAWGIITDAEQRGLLKPGQTIVEGTAGNTGIGLTVIGHARGYSSTIIIPETQAPEKIQLLKTLGADVITVPAKPYSDPDNYNHIARRLAEERGWFWANQFDNTANRDAHYKTTGPEIWNATGGRIEAFGSGWAEFLFAFAALTWAVSFAYTVWWVWLCHPDRHRREIDRLYQPVNLHDV